MKLIVASMFPRTTGIVICVWFIAPGVGVGRAPQALMESVSSTAKPAVSRFIIFFLSGILLFFILLL